MLLLKTLIICATFIISLILIPVTGKQQETCAAFENEVGRYLLSQNELLRLRKREEYLAAYKYNTNVTEENRLAMIEIATKNAAISKRIAQELLQTDYRNVVDECKRRQIEYLSELGVDALNAEDYKELQNAISNMQTNYATTRVCSFLDRTLCNLQLEPQIQERIANSRIPDELEFYWKEFHDKAGTPMRQNFTNYVKLSTKAANLNNYHSYADYWIHFYEDRDFESNLDSVYQAILPFYRDLHAYVRYRLNLYYNDLVAPPKGNIPIHLLGNMWGQQWDLPIDIYTPYPNEPFVNVTEEMIRKDYSVRKLFELADEFFTSLNMRALPESFWRLSVLQRPSDRPIVCHASAWDFYQDSDVRIKMCTQVDTYYLYVAHHEMGHIQYYLQYENQPTVFRAAPNPGFHEAVGDTVALFASSAKHLNKLGLLPSPELNEEQRINTLFRTALQKVVFLPFAYSLDKYRYAIFRNEFDENIWNCAYWKMRSEYTGLEPPINRTDLDFDPPAKYHVSADVEYLRYFAAHIFQFQFYRALCRIAGEYEPNNPAKPLDNCDIYNNKAAGRAFSEFLALGSSVHWKDALEQFTGEREMDPSALLEYFEPLRKWLRAEITRLDIPVGWEMTNKIPPNCCPRFST